MRYGSIYLITNLINGKKYVGLTTTTVEARWASHKCQSSTCTYLHKALSKYGHENFKIEELVSSWDKEFLEALETYFIMTLDCIAPRGYNLTSGGGFHGKQSKITRNKKSKFHKKLWKDFKQDSQKYENRLKGVKNYIDNKKVPVISVNLSTGIVNRYPSFAATGFSSSLVHAAVRDFAICKNHLWFKNEGQSDVEVISKTLLKLKGRWQPENINAIVAEHYITGERIEFSNIQEAKKALNLDAGLIRKCFTGRLNRAKEWKFRLK